MTDTLVAEIEQLGETLARARASVNRRFLGQTEVVDLVLASLLCGGHALLVGLPGLTLDRPTAENMAKAGFAVVVLVNDGRPVFWVNGDADTARLAVESAATVMINGFMLLPYR